MATTRLTLGRMRAGLLASAAIVALAIAPVNLSGDGLSLEASSALAKGGQGGDRSSGKGGNGNGNANGHGKNGNNGNALIADDGPSANHGALVSAMGRLNAYHASDQAKENALAKGSLSAVGAVAAYEAALADYLDDPTNDDLLADVADALATAANKDIDTEVVSAFNDALGFDTELSESDLETFGLAADEDLDAKIANAAQEIQDDETSQGLGDSD